VQAEAMIARRHRRLPDRDLPGPAPGQGRGRGRQARHGEAGVDLPVLVNVTVETTGTMLLGSEIGAALAALEPLGIDVIGLNCATGPAEMSEHLRHLSRFARIGVAACRTPACPS
jgi:5-methyltetrahydrofolate--homocysteine methyltransferase